MSADGKFNKSLFGFNKRQVLGFFEDYQNEKQAEIDEIKEQKNKRSAKKSTAALQAAV